MRLHPATWIAFAALLIVPVSLIRVRPRSVGAAPAVAAYPIMPAAAGTLDHAVARHLFAIAPAGARTEDETDGPADPDAPPQLVGIVGRLPDNAVVLVRRASGGTRTLTIGDSVSGWRLDSIAPTAALFVHGERRLRVDLPSGDAPDQ